MPVASAWSPNTFDADADRITFDVDSGASRVVYGVFRAGTPWGVVFADDGFCVLDFYPGYAFTDPCQQEYWTSDSADGAMNLDGVYHLFARRTDQNPWLSTVTIQLKDGDHGTDAVTTMLGPSAGICTSFVVQSGSLWIEDQGVPSCNDALQGYIDVLDSGFIPFAPELVDFVAGLGGDPDMDGYPSTAEAEQGSHAAYTESTPSSDDDGDCRSNAEEAANWAGPLEYMTDGSIGLALLSTCGGASGQDWPTPPGTPYDAGLGLPMVFVDQHATGTDLYVYDYVCTGAALGAYEACRLESEYGIPSTGSNGTLDDHAVDGWGWRLYEDAGNVLDDPREFYAPCAGAGPQDVTDDDGDMVPAVRICRWTAQVLLNGSLALEEQERHLFGDADDDPDQPIPTGNVTAAALGAIATAINAADQLLDTATAEAWNTTAFVNATVKDAIADFHAAWGFLNDTAEGLEDDANAQYEQAVEAYEAAREDFYASWEGFNATQAWVEAHLDDLVTNGTAALGDVVSESECAALVLLGSAPPLPAVLESSEAYRQRIGDHVRDVGSALDACGGLLGDVVVDAWSAVDAACRVEDACKRAAEVQQQAYGVVADWNAFVSDTYAEAYDNATTNLATLDQVTRMIRDDLGSVDYGSHTESAIATAEAADNEVIDVLEGSELHAEEPEDRDAEAFDPASILSGTSFVTILIGLVALFLIRRM